MYELAPVPTSMFSDTGDMKISKSKSDLKKLLQTTVSVRQIEKEITCFILDGSAILYVVKWPANGTLKDYVDNFKSYISKMLHKVDVYMVLDRYRPFSTKSVTRSGRTTQACQVHQLNLDMQLPPQGVVLTVTENKRQLIKVISDELIRDDQFRNDNTQKHKLIVTGENDIPSEVHKGIVIERGDMKTTHEEADNILVQQQKTRKEFQSLLMIQMYLSCYVFNIWPRN